MTRTAAEILADARATLRRAEQGLNDLVAGPTERRLAGVCNAIIWGRAVTNVLQHLRGVVPEFDSWYKPKAEVLSRDPVARFLYKLRSQVLKEGLLPVSGVVHIHSLSLPHDAARFGPPPPGATGFFIADAVGGIGWEVTLPDGSIEKYYVELPPDIGTVETLFAAAPPHKGSRVAVDVIRYYLTVMRELIHDAEHRFGDAG